MGVSELRESLRPLCPLCPLIVSALYIVLLAVLLFKQLSKPAPFRTDMSLVVLGRDGEDIDTMMS